MSNEFEKILNELKKETSFDLEFDKNFSLEGINDVNKNSDSKKIKFHYPKNLEPEDEKKIISKYNIAWSENKETLLFFMIISIIVILIGLISSFDYIIFGGVFSFILSSIIVFITFYRYIFTVSMKTSVPDDVLDRIEKLETKVDYLMREQNLFSKKIIGSEIVDEINELKTIVKTLVASRNDK